MIVTASENSSKEVTVIDEFDVRGIDLQRLASDLKSSLGCGGTVHEHSIELQGNHRTRDLLAAKGIEIRE